MFSRAPERSGRMHALNLLLKAPAKETVLELCDAAFLLRDVLEYPDHIVQSTSSTLGITKGEAKKVIKALSSLIKEAVFLVASEPNDIVSVFPDDFDQNLKKLLGKIIIQRYSSWKDAILGTGAFHSQLVDVKCQLSSAIGGEDAGKRCIMQMTVQEQVSIDQDSGKITPVSVALSKDNLDMMLKGLGKIRDQLSSVAQKS